jgi:hypothetical protein
MILCTFWSRTRGLELGFVDERCEGQFTACLSGVYPRSDEKLYRSKPAPLAALTAIGKAARPWQQCLKKRARGQRSCPRAHTCSINLGFQSSTFWSHSDERLLNVLRLTSSSFVLLDRIYSENGWTCQHFGQRNQSKLTRHSIPFPRSARSSRRNEKICSAHRCPYTVQLPPGPR